MKRISKLTINNFKAFKECETFSFDSKNILIHGTNGSGKSSVYWSLYTFLQSSVKDKFEDVNKYFKLNHPQSLRNIHASDSADSFIELELEDTESNTKQTYKISESLVNTQEHGDTNIKDANQSSDFVNYRLLLNFYNSAHSEEIELFWVFHRDILPYFNNKDGENLGVLYKRISEETISKRKAKEKQNRNIPNLSSKTISALNKKYNTEIIKFNQALATFVTELIQPANNFLNKYFQNNDSTLKISLELVSGAMYHSKTGELSPPNIKMTIEQILEDGSYKVINRPHSFLNEAKLTQIALSVRLATMIYRVHANDLLKFLVLDDMLISLDMSNRMNIVKILLTESLFSDYQLIIMTHDKAFFNLIKQKTISQEWKYFDFTRGDKPTSKPIIKDSKDEFEKAKEYFENNEFDACANYLRKSAEIFLTNFLDPNMKEITKEYESLANKIKRAKNAVADDNYSLFCRRFIKKDMSENILYELDKDFENNPSLTLIEKGRLRSLKNSVLRYTIDLNNSQANSVNILNELHELKNRVLNPLSHGNSMPLYEQELKDAICVIEEVKVFLASKQLPMN